MWSTCEGSRGQVFTPTVLVAFSLPGIHTLIFTSSNSKRRGDASPARRIRAGRSCADADPAAVCDSTSGAGAAAGVPSPPVEQEPARARGSLRRRRDRPPAGGAAGRGGVRRVVPGLSATYLVNDVRDREQDRQHPRKRSRPVAAGELSPRMALLDRRGAGDRGHRRRDRDHPRAGRGRLRLSGVDGELLAVVAARGRGRHPGDRRRLRAARRGGRRRDRHLPVALVCHRDGVLRDLSGRRQAVCRAARCTRSRARAGNPAALLARRVCA